jgi:hypothetical protein
MQGSSSCSGVSDQPSIIVFDKESDATSTTTTTMDPPDYHHHYYSRRHSFSIGDCGMVVHQS